jgi:hypothetical protein
MSDDKVDSPLVVEKATVLKSKCGVANALQPDLRFTSRQSGAVALLPQMLWTGAAGQKSETLADPWH